ncbi:MAG: alpha/beta fold hydrolase [Pseudomonadota bacterium]
MSNTDRGYRFDGGRIGFLLAHGLGGTPTEMRYLALGLSKAGYTVSVPQLAGHGGTEDDIRKSTWQDWYGTLDRELTQLKSECDLVFVCGLSGGAILSLNLAADRGSDVAGVMLLAPTFRLDGWSIPWYARYFDLVLTKSFANLIPFVEREPYGIKDHRLRHMVAEALANQDTDGEAGLYCTPGGTILELRWLTDVVKRKLPGIKLPIMIMHPRFDDRASLNNTAYLQRHLGGLVETVVLDDCYHIVTIDRQRDIVLERVKRFASYELAARGVGADPTPQSLPAPRRADEAAEGGSSNIAAA